MDPKTFRTPEQTLRGRFRLALGGLRRASASLTAHPDDRRVSAIASPFEPPAGSCFPTKETELPEHFEGLGKRVRPAPAGRNLASDLTCGRTRLLPTPGDFLIDRPIGIGCIAPAIASRSRITSGSARQRIRHAADPPSVGGLEEEPAPRFLAKARIDEHASPVEDELLGAAQALGIGPLVPLRRVEILAECGGSRTLTTRGRPALCGPRPSGSR